MLSLFNNFLSTRYEICDARYAIRTTIYEEEENLIIMELNEKNKIEETEETEKKSVEEIKEMFDESLETFKKIERGDIIKGKIVKAKADGYFVDIKYKMEGYLPKN